MIVWIGAAGLAAFLAVQLLRNRKVYEEELERFRRASKNKVTAVEVTRNWTYTQYVFIAMLAVFGIYVYTHPETSTANTPLEVLVLCLLVAATILVNMFTMRKYMELYVNKDGFNCHGRVIRYSSVKAIEPRMGKCEVILNDRTRLEIPAAHGNAVRKIMAEKGMEI